MNRSQFSGRSFLSYRNRPGFGDQFIAAMTNAMSRAFHTNSSGTIIVGVNPITRLLASELQAIGKPVSLVDLRGQPFSEDESRSSVHIVHPATSNEVVLSRAGVQNARCLVAALADEDRNLRLCHAAIDKFGIPVAIARLHLMSGVTTWARVGVAGISRVSWNGLIGALLPDVVLTQALSRVATADDREQICEIEISLPVFVGLTSDDLPLNDCEVVAITRNGKALLVHEARLEMGDVLTLIGMKAALEGVRETFASL
jgi:Trk K+ transport system NAD-binding subunit